MAGFKGEHRIYLKVMMHLGHIFLAMGQACTSEDAVIVCRNSNRTTSSVHMDFYIAKDYTSCSCNIMFTQNDSLNFITRAIPGADCGTFIRLTNTRKLYSIVYKCTSNAAIRESFSAIDSLSIEIRKDDGYLTHESDYCIQIWSANDINFSLSCLESGNGTISSATSTSVFTTTSTSVSTTKNYTTPMHMGTTSISTSPSAITQLSMTPDTRSTDVTPTTHTMGFDPSYLEITTGKANMDDADKSEFTAAHVVIAAFGGAGFTLGVVAVILLFLRHKRLQRKQREDTYVTQSYSYDAHNYDHVHMEASQ